MSELRAWRMKWHFESTDEHDSAIVVAETLSDAAAYMEQTSHSSLVIDTTEYLGAALVMLPAATDDDGYDIDGFDIDDDYEAGP